jgi:hypothetical protein
MIEYHEEWCLLGCYAVKTSNLRLNIISVERKKNWARLADGGLIQGQTGQLTVDRKITRTSI